MLVYSYKVMQLSLKKFHKKYIFVSKDMQNELLMLLCILVYCGDELLCTGVIYLNVLFPSSLNLVLVIVIWDRKSFLTLKRIDMCMCEDCFQL